MASIDLMGASEVERRFAEQVERGEFDMFNAPGTGVLLSHAGGGRFGIVIAVPDPAMATGITTPDDAKALALRLVRQVRDARVHHAIEAGIWEEGNPLIWLIGDIEPLPHYHAGAVALCGDAAHPMIPVVAQGANQSFEDAWRLAHHLEGIARSGDVAAIPAALDRYSRERAPHVAPIQREARRRMIFQRFRSRVAHRINMRILAWLPQNIFDRFDRHLLRYAIADPDCPIESF
jgi:2-polyprenyl-6-methoxyphenol hydroxylase-like FAD-dependent oxidoreductase